MAVDFEKINSYREKIQPRDNTRVSKIPFLILKKEKEEEAKQDQKLQPRDNTVIYSKPEPKLKEEFKPSTQNKDNKTFLSPMPNRSAALDEQAKVNAIKNEVYNDLERTKYANFWTVPYAGFSGKQAFDLGTNLVKEGTYTGVLEGVTPIINKLLGKGLGKLTQKKTFNNLENSSGNTFIKKEDAQKAFEEAKSISEMFFDSPVIRETSKHNRELYQKLNKVDRFGDDLVEYRKLLNKRKVGSNITYFDPADKDMARIGRTNSINGIDQIQLNLANPQTYNHAVNNYLHEFLHHGYYGDGVLGHPNKNYIDRFLQMKRNKLYKPENQLDPEWADYLLDPRINEGATNIIDLGRDLGLQLGQKYPGKDKVLELLQSYTGRKRFVRDALDLSTTPHIKRVWDAMTGKYFTIPAIGVGAATLKVENK